MRIKCDRCQREVEGFSENGWTGGYYETKHGSYWHKFANKDEAVVCDNCMWNDERYIAVYGKRKTSNDAPPS